MIRELSRLGTIWKFPVPIEDDFELQMPLGAVPLSVGVQHGSPVLWAAVDPDTVRKEIHHFHLFGTGHPRNFGIHYRFIGTFQLEPLGLVYHLFDGDRGEERT